MGTKLADGSRSDTREHVGGQADLDDELRARVSSWAPVRPTRLRRERGSGVVVWPNQCHEDIQLATSNTARDVSAGQRQNGVDICGEFAGWWTQELKDGLSCSNEPERFGWWLEPPAKALLDCNICRWLPSWF